MMGLTTLAQKVKNAVQPITQEELEAKRKKYWERIDATIYDRRTGDTLMAFQREGVDWLGLHPRGILADDMGLGKTVQALASVVGADAFPCLFITQATLRGSMANQVARWTGMQPYVMDTGNRSLSIRQMQTLPRPFYICHYEGVRAEWTELKKIEWKSIIVDEATNIKNRQAQRTKAVKALRAPRITLLTGTPLLNSPLDLWSLLNYLNPTKYSSYYAFEKRYAIMGGWQNKQVMGFKNVPELHMHVQANMKRRRKDEVLKQLRPKTYSDVMLDLPPWQRKIYNKAHDE
jgi:SWI/SNF-related matrix-associated actin-dependent regulator of chromatin subfamily A member 5